MICYTVVLCLSGNPRACLVFSDLHEARRAAEGIASSHLWDISDEDLQIYECDLDSPQPGRDILKPGEVSKWIGAEDKDEEGNEDDDHQIEDLIDDAQNG